MQELPFLHSARRLMLIDICMKFREDSFRGFQVTERTGFVTDRRTSGRPGKNNMSPNPSGGDIITKTSSTHHLQSTDQDLIPKGQILIKSLKCQKNKLAITSKIALNLNYSQIFHWIRGLGTKLGSGGGHG